MNSVTTILRDLFGVAGGACVVAGFYLGLGLPCALIAGGALAIAVSVLIAAGQPNPPGPQ